MKNIKKVAIENSNSTATYFSVFRKQITTR